MQFCLKRSSLLFNFIIYTFTCVIKYSFRELNYCLLFISMNGDFFFAIYYIFCFYRTPASLSSSPPYFFSLLPPFTHSP